MDVPSYLLGRIKGSGGAGVKYIVVEELPATGEAGTIYLVPKEDSQTDNVYNEYMYINEDWELIGDTQADLSDYLQESDLKTINGNSIVGSGDLAIEEEPVILEVSSSAITSNNINTADNRAKIQEIYDAGKEFNNVFIIGTSDKTWAIESIKKLVNGYNQGIMVKSLYYNANGTLKSAPVYLLTIVIRNDIVSSISVQSSFTNNYYTDDEKNNILFKNNTNVFTPTGNYNPATKKYVDDSIASAITTALQGNY